MKFTHSLFFPTKLQLQTKQQIFGNPKLVELSAEQVVVKLPELTTVVAFLGVRDNPSSNGFIVVTRTTAPKLTVPPFDPNETTTGRRKPTPRATQPAQAQHD